MNDINKTVDISSLPKLTGIRVDDCDISAMLTELEGLKTFPKSVRYNTLTTEGLKNSMKEAFCVGILHSYRHGPIVSPKTFNDELLKLQKVCCSLARKYAPGFLFTCMQINKNFDGALHVDRGNVGPSMMITFGRNLSGGELYVHKSGIHSTMDSVVYFDGTEPHMTLPYDGIRYSIVLFCHMSALSVYSAYPDDINRLSRVGYNIPHIVEFKALVQKHNANKIPVKTKLEHARQLMPPVVRSYDAQQNLCVV